MRLLGAGVTVARTDDDLVRYHGKLMIIDRRVLYLLAFNFTYLDMERSRSFGIVTTNKKHVRAGGQAVRSGHEASALYARQRDLHGEPAERPQTTHTFIKGAKKELLIYDPEISDPAMVRLLEARVESGSDCQYHRQAGREKQRAAGAARRFRCVCTRVRSSATEPGHLSEARVFARSNWIPGAKSELFSAIRKSSAGWLKTFKEDWESGGESADPADDRRKKSAKRESASAAKVAKKVAKAVVNEMSSGDTGRRKRPCASFPAHARCQSERAGDRSNGEERGEGCGQDRWCGISWKRPWKRTARSTKAMKTDQHRRFSQPVSAHDPCAQIGHAAEDPDSAIVQDFEKRVSAYVQLRKSIESNLPTLKSTRSQEKISHQQHELAAPFAKRGKTPGRAISSPRQIPVEIPPPD